MSNAEKLLILSNNIEHALACYNFDKNTLPSHVWASDKTIKSIYKLGEDDFSCSICTEDTSESNDGKMTNCHHFFHKVCLEEWFREGHNNCPTCRKNFL